MDKIHNITKNFYKKQPKEKVLYNAYDIKHLIEDIKKPTNYIDPTLIKEKDKIIAELKEEIKELKIEIKMLQSINEC